MNPTFRIVFSGELLAGFEGAQVKEQFAKRFGVSDERIARVFDGSRVVLKRGLDERQADAYVRQLETLGLRVAADPESADAATATPAAPEAEPPSASGHRIVFAGGLLPGFERQAVIADAKARLKLDDQQASAMFSGREMALKRGLDAAAAERYVAVLGALGMDVRSEPPLPGSAAEPAAAEAAAAEAAAAEAAAAEAAAAAAAEAAAAEAAAAEAAAAEAAAAEAAAAEAAAAEAAAAEAAAAEAAAAGRQIGAEHDDALGETMFMSELDPSAADFEPPLDEESDEDVEERLQAAMNAEFDLPELPTDGFAHKAPSLPTDTDLAMASHHMSETVLNADAMTMYEDELAAAEKAEPPAQADATPVAEKPAPAAPDAAEAQQVQQESAPAPVPEASPPVEAPADAGGDSADAAPAEKAQAAEKESPDTAEPDTKSAAAAGQRSFSQKLAIVLLVAAAFVLGWTLLGG